MLIIATFNHSVYLELALKQLEQTGIPKQRLLVAPLNGRFHDSTAKDLLVAHQDGATQFDKAFMFGTIFMLLGAIYGFVLPWGPIIWGLIGIATGGIVGFVLDYFVGRRWSKKSQKPASEVVVLIDCGEEAVGTVERVLWTHQALGMTKIDNQSL